MSLLQMLQLDSLSQQWPPRGGPQSQKPAKKVRFAEKEPAREYTCTLEEDWILVESPETYSTDSTTASEDDTAKRIDEAERMEAAGILMILKKEDTRFGKKAVR